LLHPRQAGALSVQENAAPEVFPELRVPDFVERDFVFLFHLVARVGEVLGEIAVACQEEQAFRLRVEATDVEEARKLRRQEIIDRIGGVRIAPGGNETGRFVEQDGQALFLPNEFVIDLDVSALVNLGAEVGARLPVDRDTPGGDQLVALPARAEAGSGKEAVEAHGEP